MKPGKPLRRDTPKSRAWANAPRKRLPARSAKTIADAPRRAEVRARVLHPGARCLLAPGEPVAVVLAALVESPPACAGPLTPHHVLKASGGGGYTDDNLVALCARHNGWVEDEPDLAYAIGLVIRAGDDG